MNKPNPNGANENREDPREQVFWDLYVKATVKGKPNAYQCAIKAGYSKSHAENITIQDWFKDRTRKMKSRERVEKSEKVFDEILALDPKDGGEKLNPQLLKIKADISKFLATTQGKDDGYSARTELTGKDGSNLTIQVMNYADNSPAQLPAETVSDSAPSSD